MGVTCANKVINIFFTFLHYFLDGIYLQDISGIWSADLNFRWPSPFFELHISQDLGPVHTRLNLIWINLIRINLSQLTGNLLRSH